MPPPDNEDPVPIRQAGSTKAIPVTTGKGKAPEGKGKRKELAPASPPSQNPGMANLRIECLRKNPLGVRLIASSPEKNAQIVAAYLYFGSVTELKTFIATPSTYSRCRTGTISILIV
jgi:hypothetical protein